MEELVTQIIGYLRGMWRFRWWGLALAWVVGVVGGVVVYTMPDRYESSARIHVDTQSVLRPLMSGLAVQPNIGQQIELLSRTLISRPNVEKLITMADLDLTVQTPEQREALIASVTKSLRIQSGRGDNLFTLSFTDTEPVRAQRVVQSLLSLFVESGLGGKRQDSDAARRFIEEQIRNYEQKLAEAENRLKEFRLRNMALLGAGTRDYVSQIAESNEQLRQSRLELKEAEDSRDALRQQLVFRRGDDFHPGCRLICAGVCVQLDGHVTAVRKPDGVVERQVHAAPAVLCHLVPGLPEFERDDVPQLQHQSRFGRAAPRVAGVGAAVACADEDFQSSPVSLAT